MAAQAVLFEQSTILPSDGCDSHCSFLCML